MFYGENQTEMDRALEALGKKGQDQAGGEIILLLAGLALLYFLANKK